MNSLVAAAEKATTFSSQRLRWLDTCFRTKLALEQSLANFSPLVTDRSQCFRGRTNETSCVHIATTAANDWRPIERPHDDHVIRSTRNAQPGASYLGWQSEASGYEGSGNKRCQLDGRAGAAARRACREQAAARCLRMCCTKFCCFKLNKSIYLTTHTHKVKSTTLPKRAGR